MVSLKLAAVQAASIFLNKSATTQKACDLITQAGRNVANIIGFPEAFIPGYPGWNPFIADADPLKTSLYLQLFDNSLEVPGPEVSALQDARREANISAGIGINERIANTTGTLYKTHLIIGSDGSLLHKHQKYVPTVGEPLIHAPGQTGSKTTAQTEFGGLSGLICAENGNPLGQYATAIDYPAVHVASWPQFLNFGVEVNDLINAVGRAVAFSVGAFVIKSASVVADDEIELYGTTDEIRNFMRDEQKKRRAVIFGPGGNVITGPSANGSTEDILYADVETEAVKAYKHTFDYAGHYQKPEIFAPLFAKQ
ncbi:nitrilase/cyanide hydratase and apolipo protein N-acyltransferase [Paraphoma chrysanthemicola]|uniref:Nitrilase/cyanide hydratase and apolipo protein N-acyltransferase n=1 Tax=Paraphoma chrysanthemicola TaxID=798071 RepID=A0A8K0VSR1_9PLEO|nr:nitrilase/cyanide hydratase and apolipo protein N-acyltransferase [Paraphoma chrysanthemicola]